MMFLFALVMLASLHETNAGSYSSGGVAGMKCYQSYADSSKDVCEVSVYAVIANPDRYEGRNIRVTGYLRRVYDVLVLYPGRDADVYSAGRGGIELLVGNPDDIEIMRGRDEMDGATTVIGEFTTQIGSRVRGSIGMVTGELTVFAEEEPGSPPKLPSSKRVGGALDE